ncbi:MAG: hypothetical protein KDA84_06000, partial [Planctomycetaceae bacterium]|nr:hypothetical protein [Planctomycetaceae bacterium]
GPLGRQQRIEKDCQQKKGGGDGTNAVQYQKNGLSDRIVGHCGENGTDSANGTPCPDDKYPQTKDKQKWNSQDDDHPPRYRKNYPQNSIQIFPNPRFIFSIPVAMIVNSVAIRLTGVVKVVGVLIKVRHFYVSPNQLPVGSNQMKQILLHASRRSSYQLVPYATTMERLEEKDFFR